MNSLHSLLAGAIDYAGLFPPASLGMESAVQNFARYRTGEYSWTLGRFIVPVARLVEFEQALIKTCKGREEGWRVSALAGSNPHSDVAAIFGFNKRHAAMIDTIELKASTIDGIKVASMSVPALLTTFVEIPLCPDPSPLISAIGQSGLRAKVRTGGITTEAFPVSERLAAFIRTCRHAQVPFKATAGLHHPLRAPYRLTYEPDAPTSLMYGFLNVFVAAGVAYNGGSFADIVAALEEQSPLAIHINDGVIGWRVYKFDATTISSFRSELATSFGSCSFTEPIDDLKTLKLL